MEKKTDSTDFIGARIEPNLKKQFETAAKKDDRSISSALVVAIKDFIQKIKEKTS
jgi:hypothetical protein